MNKNNSVDSTKDNAMALKVVLKWLLPLAMKAKCVVREIHVESQEGHFNMYFLGIGCQKTQKTIQKKRERSEEGGNLRPLSMISEEPL